MVRVNADMLLILIICAMPVVILRYGQDMQQGADSSIVQCCP